MNNKLFVGNLSFGTSEEELTELFTQVGSVVSTHIPKDKFSGKQRGFGFVEMENQSQAESAIKQFDGKTVQGRQISVSISQPKPRAGNRY